eukprot:TRINITY_DN54741_c0_g1_i2.p1 TRINITY_DN54741_c0_g1~~TRINITY_DN54741_c0_g1_i2.p1  ORF type:complete len:165 (-),score=3.00 TRINITY_DN54741_c0_g1_i2:24-518(-)
MIAVSSTTSSPTPARCATSEQDLVNSYVLVGATNIDQYSMPCAGYAGVLLDSSRAAFRRSYRSLPASRARCCLCVLGSGSGTRGSGRPFGSRDTNVRNPCAAVYLAVVNGFSAVTAVSYTHLRAHETPEHLVCRLLLEKKKTLALEYLIRLYYNYILLNTKIII